MRMRKGVEGVTNLYHVSSTSDLRSTLQCSLGSPNPYAYSACIQLLRQDLNPRNRLGMPARNAYTEHVTELQFHCNPPGKKDEACRVEGHLSHGYSAHTTIWTHH